MTQGNKMIPGKMTHLKRNNLLRITVIQGKD